MNLKYWQNVQVFEDDAEHVTKFVFTKEDAVVETVLYRYPTYRERTVICHSVMSGCPMGCRFCGTGDYFVRNLTANEMIEQVYIAIDYACSKESGLDDGHKIKKLQIMSMSMGEPMLNKELDVAYRKMHRGYPHAALLMSTSGPAVDFEWFMQLAMDIPTVGLQFSVHESTNEARNKLIPFEHKLTLEQIAIHGGAFKLRTGRKPFFNYCAHANNSSNDDALRLKTLFNPNIWNATVSVICEQNDGMPTSSEAQQSLAVDFSHKLVEHGFDVRVFDPAGQDTIGGGCGQLWYVQDWMRQNPDKARQSCGSGKDKVHIPILCSKE